MGDSSGEPSAEVLAAREQAKAFTEVVFSGPADEVSMQFARTLFKESDRGVVLAGCAYIDDELELLLRAHFSTDAHVVKKAVDPLLDEGNGPLGTFSSRGKLAYALGLIDRGTFTAVNILRNLRNTFAHRADSVLLTAAEVDSIIHELPLWMGIFIRAVAGFVKDEVDTIRSHFAEIRSAVDKMPSEAVSPFLTVEPSIPDGLNPARIKCSLVIGSIAGVIAATRLKRTQSLEGATHADPQQL